jgi:hypothetical protein
MSFLAIKPDWTATLCGEHKSEAQASEPHLPLRRFGLCYREQSFPVQTMDIGRLINNPYETPEAPTAISPRLRSTRIYWVSSFVVLACWSLLLGALFVLTKTTIDDGAIRVQFTGYDGTLYPNGDPILTQHMYYMNTFAAASLLLILVVLSLVCINGPIALLRRGRLK